MNKLQQVLQKFADTIQSNKTIQSISGGIIALMPALMLGAFASMFQQLPFEAYKTWLVTSGVNSMLQTVVNVTTNMLGLYATFSIAFNYAKKENVDGLSAGLLALVGFFIITPMNTVGEGWMASTNLPLDWLGAKGMFSGMIVAAITAKIYVYFVKKNIVIKLPDSVPEFISRSFASIIPGACIGVLWAISSFVFAKTSFGSLHGAIYTLIGTPLTNIGGTIWAMLLIQVLTGLCWFFGIHGIAVVSVVMPIWMAADAMNIAAVSAGGVPENIITYNWYSAVGNIGGAGCTLGLVLLFAFRAKSKRYKELGRLALAPSFFNINEPVVFGAPMMLNMTTLIPFVFLPPVLIGVSYLLTIIGILPVGNGIGSPVPLIGFIGFFLGGWRLALWQIIELVITVVVYLPFFKKLDNDAYAEEMNTANAE